MPEARARLGARPRLDPWILGIVNVTPDSFSDGGRFVEVQAAVDHGLALVAEGADALDVGGESTRPGAAAVDATEEIGRVVPVIAGLRAAGVAVPISVDTAKAAVARAALDAGADLVNDVTAGRDPAMFGVAAAAGAPMVLMHLRGTPRTMQSLADYDDLVGAVVDELRPRIAAARDAGVTEVIADPGLGFAKRPDDNPALVRAVAHLRDALGVPVLIGASRKRFVGALCGVERAAERVHGSVGVALAAAANGADGLRVHDVAATIQALRVFRACIDEGSVGLAR